MTRGPKPKHSADRGPVEQAIEHSAVAYLLFSLAAPQWASVSIALAMLLVALLAS